MSLVSSEVNEHLRTGRSRNNQLVVCLFLLIGEVGWGRGGLHRLFCNEYTYIFRRALSFMTRVWTEMCVCYDGDGLS